MEKFIKDNGSTESEKVLELGKDSKMIAMLDNGGMENLRDSEYFIGLMETDMKVISNKV